METEIVLADYLILISVYVMTYIKMTLWEQELKYEDFLSVTFEHQELNNFRIVTKKPNIHI